MSISRSVFILAFERIVSVSSWKMRKDTNAFRSHVHIVCLSKRTPDVFAGDPFRRFVSDGRVRHDPTVRDRRFDVGSVRTNVAFLANGETNAPLACSP